MKTRMLEMVSRFDQLPVRTRLLLTCTVVFVLVLMLDSLWFAGNFEESKKLQAQIKQLDKNIADLTNSQDQLNAAISDQRNNPMLSQLKQINQQIAESKKLLKERTINLVYPEAMAKVLKEIINRSNKLKLVSLIKQPAQILFEQDDAEPQSVQMYRHPLELSFEGNYTDTQAFIKQLEDMPQKVNFERFVFEVDKYPKSKVTLIVSTLSLNRKWIGG